jgi:hypothetical protein
LRTIAILLLVGGVLELVGGVIAAIWWSRGHPVDTAGNMAMVIAAILAGTFLSFLGTVAMSELIKLFIDIEHNSRMAIGGRTAESATVAVGPNGERRTWMAGDETAEGALMRGH